MGTTVSVPEMGTRVHCPELIFEGRPFWYRTLRHVWYTIVILVTIHPETMPMYGNSSSRNSIFYIDDNVVILAYNYCWAWIHPVYCEYTGHLVPISHHTLTVIDQSCSGIWTAELADSCERCKLFDGEVVVTCLWFFTFLTGPSTTFGWW